MTTKLRYSKFQDQIDVDAFEAAIGWEPTSQSGANDIGHCPDYWGLHKHGDTTGKFAIHREKRVFNCWVCGGGNLLSLAMDAKQMDVEDATIWIHQFATASDATDASFLSNYIDKLNTATKKSEPPLPYFNANVLSRFDVRCEYFDDKRISEETRKLFRAGYDPKSIRRGKEGVEDYTGPSVIIPHFWNGRLVGWQQRWLDEERPKWVKKWTNTFDFPKDETLFNYERVLKHWDETIVVEAAATTMYLDGQDLPCVGTFGSKVTENQMRLLRRFQGGVWLAPDYDAAGAMWIEQLADYLDRYVPVYEVPPVTIKESADLANLRPEALTSHLNRASSPLFKDMFRSGKR